MKKTLKIVIISLLLIIAGFVVFGGMMFGALKGNCSDGWQQRRLDELYKKQSSLIKTSEDVISSTSLLSKNKGQPVQRSDSRASGDCISGSPAAISLTKKAYIYEVVAIKDIRDQVTSSL